MSHNTWCSIGIETSRLLLVRRVFTSLSQFEESISTSTVEQHNQQSLRRTYCYSKLLSIALRRKVKQFNTTTTNKCHASQNKIRSVNPIPCLFIMTLKGHRTCVRSRRISSALIVTSCVWCIDRACYGSIWQMASTRILWSVALLSGTVTVYCSTGVNSIVYQLIAISTRATTSYDTYFEYNTSEKPNETKRRYQSQYGEWVAVFFFHDLGERKRFGQNYHHTAV